MDHTYITGNILMRHGFEYWGGRLYSMTLPVENCDFHLQWEENFALRLKSIWIGEEVTKLDLPNYLYHDLEYITTLELLKEFHLLLTGKPLVALAEDDPFYLEQLSYRTDWFKENFPEKDPDALPATGAFEPINLYGTSSVEIDTKNLREKGFSYRNRRFEFKLYSQHWDENSTTRTYLVWEEKKGLYLEYYFDDVCACSFPLSHIHNISALQNLRLLLTPYLSENVQLGPLYSEDCAEI